MTTYNVFCDTCEAEYKVTPLAGAGITTPTHCSYCGSSITEEAISEKDEDWDLEEDWDNLVEDDEWSSEKDK
jgi:hypothetical protein